jgi:hypothetical protein
MSSPLRLSWGREQIHLPETCYHPYNTGQRSKTTKLQILNRWFRRHATTRKVVGSIPDVTDFFSNVANMYFKPHYGFGGYSASNRNGAKTDKLTTICEPIV